MRTEDLMTQPVVTVRDSDSLERVARTMLERGIGSVVVVDARGLAVGIVTERDFVEHEEIPWSTTARPTVLGVPLGTKDLEAIYLDARPWPARRIMRTLAATLEPADPVEKALDLMVRRGTKHIAVVEDGRPVGMVSHHDFLRLVAQAPRTLQAAA